MKRIILIVMLVCCIFSVGCAEYKGGDKVETEETAAITKKNHKDYERGLLLYYKDVDAFLYDLSTNFEDYFEVSYKRDEKAGSLKRELSEEEQKELFELNYFEEVELAYGEEYAVIIEGFLNKIREVGFYFPYGEYRATHIRGLEEGSKYMDGFVEVIYVTLDSYDSELKTKKLNMIPTIEYRWSNYGWTGGCRQITIRYLDESLKNADVETVIKELGVECEYNTKKLKLKDRTVKVARLRDDNGHVMGYAYVYEDIFVVARVNGLYDAAWFWKWQFEVIKPEVPKE